MQWLRSCRWSHVSSIVLGIGFGFGFGCRRIGFVFGFALGFGDVGVIFFERKTWRREGRSCPKRLASFGYSTLASEEKASEK